MAGHLSSAELITFPSVTDKQHVKHELHAAESVHRTNRSSRHCSAPTERFRSASCDTAVGEMLRFAVAALCLSAAASIRIDTADGGYEDIKVSISKDVPYNESIVDNVKALFQSSSKFLHRATNGRVFLKHVTIELPITWPKRDGARALSSSLFERSDVRIGLPTKTYGDAPFTQQLRPCGTSGDFIQLTPGFLAKTQNATKQGKSIIPAYTFVHEWAHFRYGVFDEYGTPGDAKYPLLYCTQKGNLVLNACSRRITVKVSLPDKKYCPIENCKVPDNCTVTIPKQKASVDSSIMFMPYMENVNQFCDDQKGSRQHNPDAPNKQNILCKQRSTWEVISRHADFQNLPMPDPSKTIQVTFEEVQQKDDLAQRVVLVLDVSTSMNINNRLEFLKEAATRYVQGIEDNSRRLAIVAFSTNSTVVHPLMLVNNSTRRGYLDEIEKLKWDGFTCIGCGLKSALEQLTSSNETAEGGLVVLMSDGEENKDPRIKTMLPKVAEAKVVVSTVALGSTADKKLEELALLAGGKAFSFQDLQGNLGLDMEAAFVEATTTQGGSIHQSQTLMKSEDIFTKTFEKTFYIDSEVGNNTEVYVNKNHSGAIEAWLVGPSGHRCNDCDMTQGENYVRILIPTTAEVGDWTLHLSSNTSDPIAVSMQVRSKARTENEEPIRVSCELGSLLVGRSDEAVVYAKVTKGSRVLLDAVVYAMVTGPNQPYKTTFRLYDNGEVPDNQADDGTYSGYFSNFTGKGRYTVTAQVTNQNTTRLGDPAAGSGSFFTEAMFAPPTSLAPSLYAASEDPLEDDDSIVLYPNALASRVTTTAAAEPVGPFQRVVSGGSFQVTEDIRVTQVPPKEISDLAVADVRPGPNGTLLVQLTWTWPGAHLNSGTASSVEIRASKERAMLKSSFESGTPITESNVLEGNFNPLPPGTKHVVTLSLPEEFSSPQSNGDSNWNVYFAGRVSNSDGLKSTSNIAYASFIPELVPTTVYDITETTTIEASTTEASTMEVSRNETATTEGPTSLVFTAEVTTVKAAVTDAAVTGASAIEVTPSTTGKTEAGKISTASIGSSITEVTTTVVSSNESNSAATDGTATVAKTEEVTKTTQVTIANSILTEATSADTAAITSTTTETTDRSEIKIQTSTSADFATKDIRSGSITTEVATAQANKTSATTETTSITISTVGEKPKRNSDSVVLSVPALLMIVGALAFFVAISAAFVITHCAKKRSSNLLHVEMAQLRQATSA
ncbi:calcium-activated chloride channel regulator 3A-1-like [Haemaphysalis longicornis]